MCTNQCLRCLWCCSGNSSDVRLAVVPSAVLSIMSVDHCLFLRDCWPLPFSKPFFFRVINCVISLTCCRRLLMLFHMNVWEATTSTVCIAARLSLCLVTSTESTALRTSQESRLMSNITCYSWVCHSNVNELTVASTKPFAFCVFHSFMDSKGIFH